MGESDKRREGEREYLSRRVGGREKEVARETRAHKDIHTPLQQLQLPPPSGPDLINMTCEWLR